MSDAFEALLAEHDRQVRRDVAEEIAQAIEGRRYDDQGRRDDRFTAWVISANIAREIGGRDEV